MCTSYLCWYSLIFFLLTSVRRVLCSVLIWFDLIFFKHIFNFFLSSKIYCWVVTVCFNDAGKYSLIISYGTAWNIGWEVNSIFCVLKFYGRQMTCKVIIRKWNAEEVCIFWRVDVSSKIVHKPIFIGVLFLFFFFFTFIWILELRIFCGSSSKMSILLLSRINLVWTKKIWCESGMNQGPPSWDWSNCIGGMVQEAVCLSKEGL